MGMRFRKYLLILAGLLCLAGCGEGTGGAGSGGQQTVVGVQSAERETERLYVNAYIPLPFAKPDEEYQDVKVFYDTYGGKLYALCSHTSQGNEAEELALYIFDGETKGTETYAFALRTPERIRLYRIHGCAG